LVVNYLHYVPGPSGGRWSQIKIRPATPNVDLSLFVNVGTPEGTSLSTLPRLTTTNRKYLEKRLVVSAWEKLWREKKEIVSGLDLSLTTGQISKGN